MLDFKKNAKKIFLLLFLLNITILASSYDYESVDDYFFVGVGYQAAFGFDFNERGLVMKHGLFIPVESRYYKFDIGLNYIFHDGHGLEVLFGAHGTYPLDAMQLEKQGMTLDENFNRDFVFKFGGGGGFSFIFATFGFYFTLYATPFINFKHFFYEADKKDDPDRDGPLSLGIGIETQPTINMWITLGQLYGNEKRLNFVFLPNIGINAVFNGKNTGSSSSGYYVTYR